MTVVFDLVCWICFTQPCFWNKRDCILGIWTPGNPQMVNKNQTVFDKSFCVFDSPNDHQQLPTNPSTSAETKSSIHSILQLLILGSSWFQLYLRDKPKSSNCSWIVQHCMSTQDNQPKRKNGTNCTSHVLDLDHLPTSRIFLSFIQEIPLLLNVFMLSLI